MHRVRQNSLWPPAASLHDPPLHGPKLLPAPDRIQGRRRRPVSFSRRRSRNCCENSALWSITARGTYCRPCGLVLKSILQNGAHRSQSREKEPARSHPPRPTLSHNSNMENNSNNSNNMTAGANTTIKSNIDGNHCGDSNNNLSTTTYAGKHGPTSDNKPAPPGRLYKAAARNLGESHGVQSMMANDLKKTMSLLQLGPRRLVVQGLAPRRLLKDEKGSEDSTENKLEVDETDSMATELEYMKVNNDKVDSYYESSEGQEEAGVENALDKEKSWGGDEDKDEVKKEKQSEGGKKARRPIHTALLAGGISIRPREIKPLLRALGLGPRRFVRLGLVDRKALCDVGVGRDQCHSHGLERRLHGGGGRHGRGADRMHGGPHSPPPGRRGGGRHGKHRHGKDGEEERGHGPRGGGHHGPPHGGPVHVHHGRQRHIMTERIHGPCGMGHRGRGHGRRFHSSPRPSRRSDSGLWPPSACGMSGEDSDYDMHGPPPHCVDRSYGPRDGKHFNGRACGSRRGAMSGEDYGKEIDGPRCHGPHSDCPDYSRPFRRHHGGRGGGSGARRWAMSGKDNDYDMHGPHGAGDRFHGGPRPYGRSFDSPQRHDHGGGRGGRGRRRMEDYVVVF